MSFFIVLKFKLEIPFNFFLKNVKRIKESGKNKARFVYSIFKRNKIFHLSKMYIYIFMQIICGNS